MTSDFDIKEFLKRRPLSWSALSSFEWNPEQWYKRYILGEKQEESMAMIFGKVFANSCEKRKPLAPVTLYSEVEYPLNVMFNGIPLIGFIDTYEPHTKLGEFKTGKGWDQKKVDSHGQIDMYLLQIFITHKVRPEDIHCQIQWIPTIERGDFSVEFVKPVSVHTFETKRSMVDLVNFGARINRVVKEMQNYVNYKKMSDLNAVHSGHSSLYSKVDAKRKISEKNNKEKHGKEKSSKQRVGSRRK